MYNSRETNMNTHNYLLLCSYTSRSLFPLKHENIRNIHNTQNTIFPNNIFLLLLSLNFLIPFLLNMSFCCYFSLFELALMNLLEVQA